MDSLPKDVAMLLSFLNMKLRDEYDTPEALVRGLDLDADEFAAYIAQRGISYFPEGHRFVLD